MSNHLILAAMPTAKIQLGNKGSIEMDTSSVGGHKSVKIQIISNDDTVNKEIESVGADVKEEMKNLARELKDEFADKETPEDKHYEYLLDQQENEKEMMNSALGMAIPVLAILIGGIVAIIHSYNKRKYREALLAKGFNPEEIEKKQVVESGSVDELKQLEKRKQLKYVVILGSLGVAIILGHLTDSFWYFVGSLFLMLGAGFYYFYKKDI